MRILSGILYGIYAGESDYWNHAKRTSMRMMAMITVVAVLTVLWVADNEMVSEKLQMALKWFWYPWEHAGTFTRVDALLTSGLTYICASIIEIRAFKIKPIYWLFALVKTVAYSLMILLISVLLIQFSQSRSYINLSLSILMLLPIYLMLIIKHNPVFTMIEHVTILWLLTGFWPLEAFRMITVPSGMLINALASLLPFEVAVLLVLFFPLGVPNLMHYIERRNQHAKKQFELKWHQ